MRHTPKLRVLVNGPLPPPVGGMQTYCVEYLGSSLPMVVDVTMCRAILIKSVATTTGPVRLGLRMLNSVLITLVWSFMLLVKWPHIAHIHTNSYTGFYVKAVMGLLARMVGTKTVLHIHGAEFRLFYGGTPWILRWTIPRLISASSKAIVLSKEWREYFVSIGVKPERIAVMTNSVFVPECVDERKEDEDVMVLFMSRMEKRKGIEELASVIERQSEALRSCRFILAGPKSHEWHAIAGRLCRDGDQALAEMPGSVEGEVKDRLYREADIYMLQSYAEGMPIGLLEAMSYGLACITTPVGGIPDVVQDGENGVLLTPGDVDGLAEALERLVKDPAYRRQLGKAARATIERKYNWATRAKEMHQLYLGLLGRDA